MTYCCACEQDECACPRDTLPENMRQLLLACRLRLVECNNEVIEATAWRNRMVLAWIEGVLG